MYLIVLFCLGDIMFKCIHTVFDLGELGFCGSFHKCSYLLFEGSPFLLCIQVLWVCCVLEGCLEVDA